ncbi:MAG: Trk system potassium transporter TrkA [Desulfovibrionaceae bacterium]|nr:Trk system potassium transporter TrkA [Desulfovibrionaceae bacterium]
MKFFFRRKQTARLKAVIIGAGEVGVQVADHLASEDKDVVLIDTNAAALREAAESMDIKTVHGQGDSPVTLKESGVERADLVLAVTDSDATNIIACLFANKLWPEAVTLARIRNEDYTRGQEDLINGVLGINTLVNPEREVVKVIERMLSLPGILEYNEFADGLVKMVSLQVDCGPMVDLQLFDFSKVVPEDIIVAAIERGDKLIVPSGQDRILAGDIVHFMTLPGNMRVLRRASHYYDQEPARSVFIVGGGNTGFLLARYLEDLGYSVKLAEVDEERSLFLAEKLHDTLVLRGDGTDRFFLKEENIGEMDAIVALTGYDEENVLIGLLAKSMGVGHAIVRVNKREYHPLVETIGLRFYVNPRTAAVNSIMRFIRRGQVMASVTLGDDEGHVIEIIAQSGSRLVDTPLFELGLPKGSLVLAIVRNGKAIIPTGQDVILAGDRVIMLANHRVMAKVETFFTPLHTDLSDGE